MKAVVSDIFIFHDNVEFTKKSLTKRTYIQKGAQDIEKKYLGIPIVKHSDYALINTLEINQSEDWVKKSINLLSNNYQSAEFYSQHRDFIFSLLEVGREKNSFSEYSIHVLKEIFDLMEIKSELYISGKLDVTGHKSEYNINLVKHFDATIYNSGRGARKYQTQEEYDEALLKLRYVDTFNFLDGLKSEYANFNVGYSIIDNLFHLGKDNLLEIVHRYKDEYESIFREK